MLTQNLRRQNDLPVLDRDARQLKLRPLPPRPISLALGVLLWDQAIDTANITHYRVYNTNGQIFAELPAGQTKLVGFDTTRAYLTSYDSRTKLESFQVYVSGTATPPGSSAPTEYSLTDLVDPTPIDPLGDGTSGEIRYVILETDATGGQQIEWDASFKGVTNDDIVNEANWTNIYGFLNRNINEWWNVSIRSYETP